MVIGRVGKPCASADAGAPPISAASAATHVSIRSGRRVAQQIDDRITLACRRFALQPRRNAFDVEPDLVEAGARRDVERLVVAVADLDIGGALRRLEGADM